MKRIDTIAAASELQADYYLTVITLRRNPEHFKMRNVSGKKMGEKELEENIQ